MEKTAERSYKFSDNIHNSIRFIATSIPGNRRGKADYAVEAVVHNNIKVLV